MKREARDRIMEAIRTVLSGGDYVSERMQKSIVHHTCTVSAARKLHRSIG
jgi:hypothetical protein